MILYIGMAAAGLVLIFWGLPAAHRLNRPYDILAALAVVAGVVVALLGALLICNPDFFQG